MSGFTTAMQATIRVPQDGFTVDDLKAHLRASKIPADARLIPTNVREVDPEPGYQTGDAIVRSEHTEVGFIAEWIQ